MQDKYEHYPRHLLQTSQKVRKSRMSPGAGAGAGVEPDFEFLLEPELEWSRVKNLAGSATLEFSIARSFGTVGFPQDQFLASI